MRKPNSPQSVPSSCDSFSQTSAEVRRLRTQLTDARRQISDLELRYAAAQAELGQAHQRLQAVEQSLTWRLARLILAPLDQFIFHRQWYRRLRGRTPATTPTQTSPEYTTWIAQNEALSAQDLRLIDDHLSRLSQTPLFSILLPVYNTPEPYLRACLDSVRQQIYPHWQLCVVDDASRASHVRLVLEEYAARDSRIQLHFRQENGHISRTSNDALAMAEGEFVVLLDHDDTLAPQALYLVAATLADQPETDILYSDEDKIDGQGQRFAPYFKPDWNPDLFLSQNYLNHLGVYRTTLVREVGGFRPAFDGSQDYDLALRCLERTSAGRIRHVPHVLYHWRATAGSTAKAPEEKSYAQDAARRAVQEHLNRQTITAQVVPDKAYNRIVYPLLSPAPRVSLIVPSTCSPQHLQWCSQLLADTDYPELEYVLVANNLPDEAARKALADFRQAPRVRVIDYDQPFSFSDIYNTAVAQTSGDILAICNDDLLPIGSDWLREMVSQALRPGVGGVGAMLYYANDTIQHAGVLLGVGGVAGHAHKYMPRGCDGYFSRARLVQNYGAVTAACLVMRRSVYTEVGGFDPGLPVAFNDVDLCLRIGKAGYRLVWTPYAELYHMESVTRGDDESGAKKERFQREMALMQSRWLPQLLNDAAFNPNLSLMSEHFLLAHPSRARKPWLLASQLHQPFKVHLDAPSHPQRQKQFRIRGWVASDAPVRSISLLGAEPKTLPLVERFDVALVETQWPHSKGFEGQVRMTWPKDNRLVLRVETEHGTTRHVFPIAPAADR